MEDLQTCQVVCSKKDKNSADCNDFPVYRVRNHHAALDTPVETSSNRTIYADQSLP
jgi:hypothetical protein